MERRFLVYKITNLKNQKTYIGCHRTYNVNDSYMGSGKLIKSAIKKHGLKFFSKTILFNFDNEKDMLIKEIELISLLKPEYNLHEGGLGGWDYMNKSGRNTSGRRRQLSRDIYVKLAREGRIKKLKENPELAHEWALKSRITVRKNVEAGLSNYPFFGKKHSEQYKKRMSLVMSEKQTGEKNSNFGKVWIKNEEMQKSISVDKTEIDHYISSGWKIGRKLKW